MNVIRSGAVTATLLGLLLARASESVPVDVLSDAIWPSGPSGTSNPFGSSDPSDPVRRRRLHVLTAHLRRGFAEPDRLTFDSGAYRLRVDPGELDADRFEALLDEADVADDPNDCADAIGRALELWRGTPYGGLDVPELTVEADRLTERRLAGLELLYRAELARGRHTAIVGDLAELAGRHPFRERLCALHMIALCRAGRQADALAAYRATRETFVDELGIDPGTELRDLEQQILAGNVVGASVIGFLDRGRLADPEQPTDPGRAPEPPPAQLPAGYRGFVGRDDELAELDRWLLDDTETPIVVISGTAGVGKTSLALRWAHRAGDRFDGGQLYVDLRGYSPDPPLAPADALAGFLRAYGQSPADVEVDELAGRFRTTVSDRRLLIMLDNACSVEQVRPLLPGTRGCAVLITSREALGGLAVVEGARRLDLDRLPRDQAALLLRTVLGDRVLAEPEAATALIEQCARLPLALRIAAEQIRLRPDGRIEDLVSELTDVTDRLDLLSVDGDPYSAVRAAFSWSYRHLSEPAARLLRLIGLHPGADLDLHALTALADAPLRAVRRTLDSLLRAHLVEETTRRRIRVHDLLRAYAAELAERVDSAADRRAADTRLQDHYLGTAAAAMDRVAPYQKHRRPQVTEIAGDPPELAGQEHALRWLDAERDNLVAVTERAAEQRRSDAVGTGEAGRVAYSHRMSVILWRYLTTGGYLRAASRLFDGALAQVRAADDRRGLSEMVRLVGLTYFGRGQYAEARRHYEEALPICREIGDRQGEAASLNSIAGCLHVTGSRREAVDYLRQSIDLQRTYGEEADTIAPRANLAYLLRLLGEVEASELELNEVIALADRHEDNATLGEALLQLGNLHADSGRLESGAELLGRVLELADAHGTHALRSDTHHDLGVIYLRMAARDPHPSDPDLLDRAEELLEAALTEAMDEDDRTAAVRARNGLAELALARGTGSTALELHRAALATAEAIGLRDEQARAHAGMSRAHTALDQPDLAVDHRRRARDIYVEIDSPLPSDLAAELDTEPDVAR